MAGRRILRGQAAPQSIHRFGVPPTTTMNLEMTAATMAPIIADVSIDLDGTFFVQVIAFVITIGALHYILLKPYMRAMEAREDSVGGSEEEAVEMQEQASNLKGKYEDRIQKARRDAQEVRESLRQQGMAEQRDIESEVREELEAKLGEERATLNAQVEEARQELQDRAEGLADAMVRRLLPKKG